MKIEYDDHNRPVRITMRTPDNWHAHFRQGEMLRFLMPHFIDCGWRGRVIAEPNTEPPILTGTQAIEYRGLLLEEARHVLGCQSFEPVVTIQITESTTPEIIGEAWELGVRVAKVYPRYVTTNSENGVVEYANIYPALHAADEVGMIVQFHPEHPSYDVIGRYKERDFRGILDAILNEVPRLKMSVEHVSSGEIVQWVMAQPDNVGASLTVQHMYVTADDLAGYSRRSGGKGCPHDALFKPCAKDPVDREAVVHAALSGSPKFWYGGDDAAHLKSKKECARQACGAWNTIAALPLLIALFEKQGKLEDLEPFLSETGAKFYGFPIRTDTVTFIRESWKVPLECRIDVLNDSVVPFFAGEEMEWKILA